MIPGPSFRVCRSRPMRACGRSSEDAATRILISLDSPAARGVLCLDGGRPGGGRDCGLPLEEDATMAKKLKPMHPGEILREEFLVPLKMSAGALAKACGLPRTRIERIASEQTGITPRTSLPLPKATRTTPQLLLHLHNTSDVQIAN